MKSFNFRLSFLLPIFLSLFFSVSLQADVTKTDTFSSSSDGWSGGSRIYYGTYSNSYRISKDATIYKTFNFDDSIYANANVRIEFTVHLDDDWEDSGNSKDYLYVYNGSTQIAVYSHTDGTYTKTINTTLDATGDILLKLKSDTTYYSEYTYLDIITVTAIQSNIPPEINVPNISLLQNENIDLNVSDYVTLTDGDPILSYAIDRSASPSLPAAITFDTSTGEFSGSTGVTGNYVVTVSATDKDGTSTSTFTITVSPPNPPTINNIPDQNITDASAFSLDISSYTDNGSGPVTLYTLGGNILPDGLDFNSTTGVLFGSTTDVGTYDLTVFATNNAGDSNVETFTINVSLDSPNFREFTQRTQHNLFGDVKVIGETVLCQINSSTGLCEESGDGVANDDVDLQPVPESSSYLDIPEDATVKYARLYWSGRLADNDDWDAAEISDAKDIEFKKKTSAAYTDIRADIISYNYYGSIPIYSASADVMSIVDTNATYQVNSTSFYTLHGDTSDGLGTSGGWMLVVVYEDPDETTARNVTIFDGYKIVTSSTDATGSVSGFVTPKTNAVDTKVYVYAAEGDKYLSGTDDRVKMKGELYNNSDWHTLGTFDSRIDVNSISSPDLINNNGIDIHEYLNPQTEEASPVDIITNNEVGADFLFTSNNDVYFPSVIVFSIELYLPKLCYDYSIRQDGQFLNVDRDAYPVAHLDNTISSSDLDITIYLRNKEADIKAQSIALKSDVNDTAFDHVGNIYTSNLNGSSLINRGTPSNVASPIDDTCPYVRGSNSLSNNGCSTGHDFRKGNGDLDAGDYIYTNYKLRPKNITALASVDEPLGLSIKYYIEVSGNVIEYPDYELGSANVPLCEPTAGYTPAWGQFNVVESGQASGSITNNIYTKISRLQFGADLVFDSNPATGAIDAPSSDVNTTVLVELIDMDSFGDINASCANPSSSLTDKMFVSVNFTGASYQTSLPSQNSSYFNFAVKNAAYRIWYFTDENGDLIQNWNAAVTDATNRSISAISGLYKPAAHGACSSACSDDTSVSCFECIKINYARPICSRDNFAVRPESYDLHIFDVDDNAATAAIKDSTKVDISTQDGFDSLSAATTDRMNLATGYTYRFDMTATGHDGINGVPGYTRHFSGLTDYNATMYWDPQTSVPDCIDTNNKNFNFYVANGVMTNTEDSHNNVGEYKLNISDTSWTAVDWSSASHHVSSNGFETTADCQVGSTTSIIASGKYGCVISTNHGSDGGGRFYQDHDIEFHPYKFNMAGITPSHGLTNNATFATDTFIYMTDMDFNNAQDQNMSFHLNGAISAVGYDDVVTTNFVDNCYAKPVTFTLNKTAATGQTNHTYRYINANKPNTDTAHQNNPATASSVANGTTLGINLATNDFNATQAGVTNTILNINLDRNSSTALNPERVTYTTYNTNCTNAAADCTMNADLSNSFTTTESLDLNQTANPASSINITYLYGRTHASRQRYENNTGTANIYYEAYCFGVTGGNTCDKTLLPQGINSKRTDDIRWYMNTSHTSNEGNAGTISERATTVHVTVAGATTGNHPDNSTLMTYDENQGYPYKTTMENNASRWLIYNEDNPTATRNSFSVEFYKSNANWSGTNTMTTNVDDNKTTVKTNRRSMW